MYIGLYIDVALHPFQIIRIIYFINKINIIIFIILQITNP